MSSADHVLIKLSDFKEICTDLKRSGDIIKGVLKTTLKTRSEFKKSRHAKRAHPDSKSDKKAKRKKPDPIPTSEENPDEAVVSNFKQQEESNSSSELSSEDGY